MKRLGIGVAVLVLTLIFPVLSQTVLAKDADNANDDIPEVNGDYPDPHHPGIRVRVFVHGPKAHAASPALVCTDPDSQTITGPAGWKLPNGTWNYNLNPGSAPSSILASNLPTIAANGFAQYTSALSSSVAKPVFSLGPNTSTSRTAYDGQNIIAWNRLSAGTLGITYIRYSTTTKVAVDVDTILNRRYAWNWNGGSSLLCPNPDSYDTQNILTHEQGHWLGLDDEYAASFTNNTMFGYGAKGEVKKDTLTLGDIAGIKAIYP